MSSLSVIKPYFRDRMNSLGLNEHRDQFSFANIPGTNLDFTYHIELGQMSRVAVDQLVYTLQGPVIVRIFQRGYNDTVQTHEDLISRIDEVLGAVLLPEDKLAADLFNILPGIIGIEEIAADNDNFMVASIEFTVEIKLCY